MAVAMGRHKPKKFSSESHYQADDHSLFVSTLVASRSLNLREGTCIISHLSRNMDSFSMDRPWIGSLEGILFYMKPYIKYIHTIYLHIVCVFALHFPEASPV